MFREMAVKKVQPHTRAPLHRSAQKTLNNKGRDKQKTPINGKNKKAVIIAQEIKFARLLASNDKRVRYQVLKNLKKWLTVRSKSSFAFTETDFMRLWKGLFYCMWMSDKPLIQEELAESLSKIVQCFEDKDVMLSYTGCALKTLGTEWFGIDQYRIDKFAMLVRRIIRQTFQKCKDRSWDLEWVKGISEVLSNLLLDSKICLGFGMHLTELFMEELSKISCGEIPEDAVTELLKPFADYLIKKDDERQIKHVMKHIFRYLIFQSDIGMDYTEKFEAWKEAGFPTGSIDAMEKIELSGNDDDDNDSEDQEEMADDEEWEDITEEEEKLTEDEKKYNSERPLDPRAGRVDVELQQIPFNAKKIAEMLTRYKFHPLSTAKSRRQILRLITEFTDLSEGNMPLGIKDIRLPNVRKSDTSSKAGAYRLLAFEKELHSDNPQSKRKRKKNGQLDNSEDASTETSDNITDEKDTVDVIEPSKKKRKAQNKTEASNNSTKSDLQKPNKISVGIKKKNCKAGKKVETNSETVVLSRNGKSKSDISLIVANNSKPKKSKTKHIKTVVKSIIDPVKCKKKKKVSNNTNPSMPQLLNKNGTESSKKSDEKVVTTGPITKQEGHIKDPLSLNLTLAPFIKKLEGRKIKTTNTSRQTKQSKLKTNLNAKKRVKIVLQRNTAQHTSEYIQQVRQSPAIPYDANKKPLVGVLKASPIQSPINPFYKKNLK